jgi:polyisoprenoid-binding protein YceI
MIRRILTVALVAAVCIVIGPAPAPAIDRLYTVDPAHTRVGFSVRHLVISNVKGNFTAYTGAFTLNGASELIAAEAAIDAASIDTGVEKRDDHLRSPDFFDAKAFPAITFESTSISHEENDYVVVGNLTIRGVTKKVTLKGELIGVVKDPWGNVRAGFTAKGRIDRKDFGLTWNKALEAGGVLVGDEVILELDVEGIETKPMAPAAGK